MEKKKVIGVASYETQQLVARLTEAVKDECYDIVSYDELTSLIGFNVQNSGRSYLTSAKEIVERETGRLLGTVRNEGVKLLTPEEQASIGTESVTRMRRATSKSIIRVARVQTEKLTHDQLREHHATASVLGALHLFTKPKSVNKIKEAVSPSAGKLAIGDTLKLFE